MPLVALQCRRCGGDLPETKPGESCSCSYCGQRYLLEPSGRPVGVDASGRPVVIESIGSFVVDGASAPPSIERLLASVAAAHPDAPASPAPAPAKVRQGPIAAIVVVSIVLAGVGVALSALWNVSGHSVSVAATRGPASPRVAGGGAGERFIWDEVGGPPQVARLPGRELVVARFREGDSDQLYVEARSAPSLERVWRAGPFGSYGEGYRATFFQIAGERLVVSEVRAKVHVYDLSGGAEVGTFPISDRPADRGLCSTADGRILVPTVDGAVWAVDAKAPSLRRAAAGDRCVEGPGRSAARPPQVPGFRAEHVLLEAGTGVALGHRVPGTPVPRVVGFSEATGAVLWSEDLAASDPTMAQSPAGELLFGGRIVATFEQGDGYRLTAIDARDGRRLWESSLPEVGATSPVLVAGGGWLYAGCLWSLLAIDPATGKVMGRLG